MLVLVQVTLVNDTYSLAFTAGNGLWCNQLDIYTTKSIKEGTEWAVFELNDEKLWLRLRATILSFLARLYQKGAFKGDGEGSAYYVVCDASLNTDANIERGIVTAEWGYANKKPAEFVVHRLNKITASSN